MTDVLWRISRDRWPDPAFLLGTLHAPDRATARAMAGKRFAHVPAEKIMVQSALSSTIADRQVQPPSGWRVKAPPATKPAYNSGAAWRRTPSVRPKSTRRRKQSPGDEAA